MERYKEELARNLEKRRVAELRRNKFLGAPGEVISSSLSNLRYANTADWDVNQTAIRGVTRLLQQTSLTAIYTICDCQTI